MGEMYFNFIVILDRDSMADPKPTKKTNTETFHVYGEDIDVTYDYIEDPEKGKLLQLDKIGGRIKLNPSQEVLSNQLFLPEYIQFRYKTDPKGGDDWLNGILEEIIIYKCRTDRDVIAAKPCLNFQAYLLQLARQISINPSQMGFISANRIGSVSEIQKQINEAAKKKLEASGGQDYGTLTITITIKLDNILNPTNGDNSEEDDDSDEDSDEDSDPDDPDPIKKKKRAIKKAFKPSNCKAEATYESISENEVRTQLGGDPMEALYRIFKQYRGKTCIAGNQLAMSLPYDDYIKMLLNQGDYQFKQYERIYELYKMMA